jgi:hypothetical protein
MGLLQAGRDGNMASKRQPTRHAFALIGAEGAGFEPAVPYSGTPLFESGTINHSDTLPPHSIAYPLLGPQSRRGGSASTLDPKGEGSQRRETESARVARRGEVTVIWHPASRGRREGDGAHVRVRVP